MLAILRFILAMFVVIAHLSEGVPFLSHWGIFAVFGFYLISGYLITTILNETYFFRFSAFLTNRFLRLFPIYYAVVLVSAFTIYVAPNANAFHPAWSPQFRLVDFGGNGLIFPFEFYDASFRVIPPAWSIAVELINYFLLWLLVARNRTMAISALLITLIYHIISLSTGADWGRRYFPFYAALLPFAIGACIYFFQSHLNLLSSEVIKRISVFSFILWIINLVFCGFVTVPGGSLFDVFFYTNLSFLTVFIYTTTHPTINTLKTRIGKILGDLAYPIFLTHWIVGFAMSQLVGERRGLTLLAASLIPILIVSFALSALANQWFEPLRTRVRAQIKPRY